MSALGFRAWRSELLVTAIAAEWALGAWLLSGWRFSQALVTSVAALIGLTAVLAFAKATGATADCGCFGRIVASADQAVLLLIGALGLAVRPRNSSQSVEGATL